MPPDNCAELEGKLRKGIEGGELGHDPVCRCHV